MREVMKEKSQEKSVVGLFVFPLCRKYWSNSSVERKNMGGDCPHCIH
jgi:ssDNA-binding Zn-finger/Zn-ribbon topoisomerase 1